MFSCHNIGPKDLSEESKGFFNRIEMCILCYAAGDSKIVLIRISLELMASAANSEYSIVEALLLYRW